MIPMRTSTIFKNRWMALLWAAGMIWLAVDVAALTDRVDEPASGGGDIESAERRRARLEKRLATLKAEGEGPFTALRTLRAAGEAAAFFTLWLKPDPHTKDELISASAGEVIEKPVTGAALIDAIIPASTENCRPGSGDPLVSRAA